MAADYVLCMWQSGCKLHNNKKRNGGEEDDDHETDCCNMLSNIRLQVYVRKYVSAFLGEHNVLFPHKSPPPPPPPPISRSLILSIMATHHIKGDDRLGKVWVFLCIFDVLRAYNGSPTLHLHQWIRHMQKLIPLHVAYSPTQHFYSRLLKNRTYPTGHNVVHARRGSLRRGEGKLPTFIQKQLKACQQFTGRRPVAFNIKPLQARSGCIQG